MKKRMLWVCGVLAVCFVLLAVLAVSHLNRNPNVGVSLTDPDGDAVLPESLVQADLKVHTGNVAELPDGCAAFVIEAADITLAEPIVQAAEDVPVIFVNRKPEMENACYIGGDAYQAGATQGALLLAQSVRGDWNEDGVVTCLLLGAGMSQPDMEKWRAGISDSLSDAGFETEFIAYEGTVFSAADAKAVCAQKLSAYGKDLEAVLMCYDSVVPGVLEAIQSVGRSVGRNLTLIGAGYNSDLAALVAEGKLSGYAYVDEEMLCQAVIAAVEACRVDKAPEGLLLEYTKVLPK